MSLPAHLVPQDFWTLAALAEQCGHDLEAPATAYEVACQFNHSLPTRPPRRAQGVAQTLIRLHRLGKVEVQANIFGSNGYRPAGV